MANNEFDPRKAETSTLTRVLATHMGLQSRRKIGTLNHDGLISERERDELITQILAELRRRNKAKKKEVEEAVEALMRFIDDGDDVGP